MCGSLRTGCKISLFSIMAYSAQLDRSRWSGICTTIAVSFERDRKEFFGNCLKIAEAKQKGASLPTERLNSTMGGVADLALRAYQLIQSTRLISAQKYIPPSDGQDFADLLWAQVCGTHMDDVFELVDRYHEKPADEAERFSFDVARYITCDDDGLSPPSMFALMVEIMMLTPQLTGHTAMIVAAAFADEKTVQDMRAQLEQKRKH